MLESPTVATSVVISVAGYYGDLAEEIAAKLRQNRLTAVEHFRQHAVVTAATP